MAVVDGGRVLTSRAKHLGLILCHLAWLGLGVAACAPELELNGDRKVLGPQVRWVASSGGGSHTCGLTDTGAGYCWGHGDGLGTESLTETCQTCDPLCRTWACSIRPVRIAPRGAWVGVTAGDHFSCGLASDGRAWCWGDDSHGNLGSGGVPGKDGAPGPAAPADVPVAVAGNLAFSRLDSEGRLTCGLSLAGSAHCWGAVSASSHKATVFQPVAVAVGHTFTSLAVGSVRVCGLGAGGAARCWGKAWLGSAWHDEPVLLPGAVTFTELSVGAEHGCGLDAAGRAWCWGRGATGTGNPLGTGGSAQVGSGDSEVPQAVLGDRSYKAISANAARTCAVASDGGLWCWGQRPGRAGGSAEPERELAGQMFVRVSAGPPSCAVTAAGALWCQGENGNGELGIGSVADVGSAWQPVSAPYLVE